MTRAVESVLGQDSQSLEFEIIVVNDGTESLPSEKWQRSNQVKIINTYHRERSVARNTGASIACGRYLHFLDDDDWLAPGAFQYLHSLSQSSHAKWLYGISQLVDRQDRAIIQLRHGLNGNCFMHVMAGEWIPLQSSLIDQEAFFNVGGFNPVITGPEDIDLLRRICLIGDIAETPNLIANITRGEVGSTTDYLHHSQSSRWAREIILESSGTFSRMRSSARNPALRGRMFRVYLTSMIWNIQRQRVFSAISRACLASATILINGKGFLHRDFWYSIIKPYISVTFTKGFEEAACV